MFAKPFKIKSNNTLKNTEKKNLIQKILDEFPVATEETAKLLVPSKGNCNCMKLVLHSEETADVFVSDGRPVLLAARGVLLPTVAALWLAPELIPTITVQAPVLPKLQNGAPLYLPGVVLPAGGAGLPLFARGARLAVRTTDNSAAAAVGLSALSSGEMLLKAGGVCMEVWHWTGDLLCREPRLARLERPRAAPPAAGDAARLAAAFSQQCQVQPSAEAWPALGASRAASGSSAGPAAPVATAAPAAFATPADTTDPAPPASENDVQDFAMEQDGPSKEESLVPTDPDELLQWALLSFLKLQAKTVELPLKTSLLYRNYLLPLCPPDRTMDVKKSSYKKVGKFLEAMQKEGLVEVREIEKGVSAVISLHREHPRVRSHAPPALPSPPPPDGAADITYTPPRVREMYSLTAAATDLFAPLKKGTTLTAAEVRATLTEYVRSRGLRAPGGGVALDALLAPLAGTAQEHIKWEELMSAVTARLTPCTELVFADGTRQLIKAKLEPITMQVVSRSGNKKVTLVSNLEAFGFVVAELARAWPRAAAAAAAATRAPGARRDQLLLQGDQTYFVARTLVEKYGLPKKFIEGADKALKKKKT